MSNHDGPDLRGAKVIVGILALMISVFMLGFGAGVYAAMEAQRTQDAMIEPQLEPDGRDFETAVRQAVIHATSELRLPPPTTRRITQAAISVFEERLVRSVT
jgi:hypothetical protein